MDYSKIILTISLAAACYMIYNWLAYPNGRPKPAEEAEEYVGKHRHDKTEPSYTYHHGKIVVIPAAA